MILQNVIKYSIINANMVDPKIIEKIDPYKSYSARQISIQGFIKNNVDNSHDAGFILRQIERMELKAININKNGLRPTWRVNGQDIIDYLQTH